MHKLPNTVQKLNKNGRDLTFPSMSTTIASTFSLAFSMSRSCMEGVTKCHEIFFDQCGESVIGAIIGIEEELGNGSDLGGAIPSVTAVDEDGEIVVMNVEGGYP